MAWLCESGTGASSLRSSDSTAYTADAPSETREDQQHLVAQHRPGQRAGRRRRRVDREPALQAPPPRRRSVGDGSSGPAEVTGGRDGSGSVRVTVTSEAGRLCARCTEAMNGPGSLPPERTRARPNRPPPPTRGHGCDWAGAVLRCALLGPPLRARESNGAGGGSPHGPSTVSVRETRTADAARLSGVVASQKPGGSSKLPCLHAWKTSDRGMRAQAIQATMDGAISRGAVRGPGSSGSAEPSSAISARSQGASGPRTWSPPCAAPA